MKKIKTLCMALLLIFVFTACGKEDSVVGNWEVTLDMTAYMAELAAQTGMQSVPGGLSVVMVYEFHEDGTYAEFIDADASKPLFDAWMEKYIEYSINYVYASYEEKGLGKKDADSALMQIKGVDVETYVRDNLAGYELADVMNVAARTGTYTEKDHQLYFDGQTESKVSFEMKKDKLILTFAEGEELAPGVVSPFTLTAR